jgi:GT2 family glycosyltransferase
MGVAKTMADGVSIGVVILNWNDWKNAADCVRSVYASTYTNVRLLVVDNASDDGSARALRDLFPELRLLQSGENRGWAGGNNDGLRLALGEGCDYVLLLNSDVMLAPDCIERLVAGVVDEPDVAAVGCLVLSRKRPDWVEYGGSRVDPVSWFFNHVSCWLNELPSDGGYESASVKGCGMLVKRQAVENVGYFDEAYFLNFDESDWTVRAREAGMKLMIARDARVYHLGAVSFGGTDTPLYRYFITRNMLRFAYSYLTRKQRLLTLRVGLWEFKNALFLMWFPRSAAGMRARLIYAIVLAWRDFLFGRYGDCPTRVRTMNRKFCEVLAVWRGSSDNA